MRLVHTADRRLGRSLSHLSSLEDHACVSPAVAETARDLQPYVPGLANGLYGRTVPPPGPVELREEIPATPIFKPRLGLVVLPGDQQNRGRLGFVAHLLERNRLHIAAARFAGHIVPPGYERASVEIFVLGYLEHAEARASPPRNKPRNDVKRADDAPLTRTRASRFLPTYTDLRFAGSPPPSLPAPLTGRITSSPASGAASGSRELTQVPETVWLRLHSTTKGGCCLPRAREPVRRSKARGLDIWKLDSQTGQPRHVSTLSGGESFATSLALTLSDVAQSSAGGICLDSLFIADGFGTLDAESLQLALATLRSLQIGGHPVGIISHVAELREQIPAPVEIVPAHWWSSLTMVMP